MTVDVTNLDGGGDQNAVKNHMILCPENILHMRAYGDYQKCFNLI